MSAGRINTRSVETEQARSTLIRYIERQTLPFVATIEPGKKRSLDQNRLQRLWLNEIAEQLPQHSAEEWRGYCKLTHGVPIMCAANDGFRQTYETVVGVLPYEQRWRLMMMPLDLPVTRLMTTKQNKAYLDAIYTEFTTAGVELTDPEMMGWK